MGLRTTLITAGLALATTFAIAQRASAPPAATAGTGATAAGNANAIQAPGQSSVPIGVNAIGAGSGTATAPVPTAVIVPANSNGFVGPAQSFPLVSTPTLTFVNSQDGTTTVPVISYGSGASNSANLAAAGNAGSANGGATQSADLNLGNVSSISELYGGDNRGIAEIARQYKARKNGVQNARLYTNADIARIRSQEGSSSSATPASDQQAAMPASDQSAEQNNQATTPQVQPPAANQKPSPFTPKKQ